MAQLLGQVGEQIPGGGFQDGTAAPHRFRSRGEVFEHTILDRHALAATGVYWTATNPTAGTQLTWQGASRSSYSATAVSVVWENFGMEGARTIFPDYLRIFNATSGTSSTDFQLAITMDNIRRWSSGGTLLIPRCVSSAYQASMQSISGITAGNVTAKSAGASVKNVGRMVLKTKAAPTVNTEDEFLLTFGSWPSQGSFEMNFNAAFSRQYDSGPLAIAPGHSVVMCFWGASQANSHTFECEFGWWEA